MTDREDRLRCYRRQGGRHIPVDIAITRSVWLANDFAEVEDLFATHPRLFPGWQPARPAGAQESFAPWQQAGINYTDSWGCVWRTAEDGMTGAVIHHPLADWGALDAFVPPDPAHHWGWGPFDWEAEKERADRVRSRGGLLTCGLRHGHTFLTLEYLRNYENLVFDMVDHEPRLRTLIDLVETFNRGLVERFTALRPDILMFPEDLGMQTGPMLSPEQFRTFIKPSYQRLMTRARACGAVVHVHSDGSILDLADDLIDAGADVLNLQDLVNGIDRIGACLKGRVAIQLDVDRQSVTVHGTPGDVDALIREEVDKLASPAGGLALKYEVYAPTPVANIRAAMDAFEHYCF
jgi:uroporphyrinogen decarboxylase